MEFLDRHGCFVSVGFVFAVGCFNSMMGFGLEGVTQRLEQSCDWERQKKFFTSECSSADMKLLVRLRVNVLCLFFSFAATAMASVLIREGASTSTRL